MKFGLVLIMLTFASENQQNKLESANSDKKIKENNAEDLILVKIEEDDYTRPYKTSSNFFGVSYCKSKERWGVQRWSKSENNMVSNGHYRDEETAAHASDTLARRLMENGKHKFILNFPDDDTEVFPEEKIYSSTYIGVIYIKSSKTWGVQRWSKKEKTPVSNGKYKNEETAARVSDTLARKLMANGEQNHKLNFPDDDTEMIPERTKSSKFIGVSYKKSSRKWYASRWSKTKKKIFNGQYKDEETAAHASDALARKLMTNGEQYLKLNFPEDNQNNKRKRSEDKNMDHSQNK